MWLIISAVAALAVTALYFVAPREYRLDLLCLALWGLTFCIFVDHCLGYEGGDFFEIDANALVLGISMLIPVFAVWEAYILVGKLKKESHVRIDTKTEES
jgi:hypothetical protein